jgi:glycosyltransferase involved in cell wall biosynthesis
MTKSTYLVACDSKNDAQVFSGTTYHLALQAVQDGLLTAMVNLYPRGIGGWKTYARAARWKLSRGSRLRHGFVFTDEFLDGVWKRHLPMLRESAIINNFQLFGSYFLESFREFSVTPFCYIDGTLDEYFNNYAVFDAAQVDATAITQALAAEHDNYAVCRKIAVMSKRSAARLVEHYEVPEAKIHVVVPGANIPERLLNGLDQQRPDRRGNRGSLVVGFIGLYPERKGLPTIAAAVQLLRRAGLDVRLRVIGKCPAAIADQEGVSYYGLINKLTDIHRFIEIVRGIDIGCMLSRAEMAGIALLEFLRLGVPVIATDVGGIPDIIDLGAGDMVAPDIGATELAERLARLIEDRDRLTALQESAWQRRKNASWRRSVRELKLALDK